MHLLDDLQWRGLLHQVTDLERARAALSTAGVRAYIGFDPTAASLHVGSLLPLVTLCRLARAGHQPIAVLGGGTGMIGDPSGKSAERKLLSDDDIARNIASLQVQVGRIFGHAGAGVRCVDNAEWLRSLSLVGFLRDIGKHFSVNAMIQRDSVKTRLEAREQGISYTEFSYMLLQAFDFLELYRRHGCVAQLGGSDQWGNIVSGIDLIERLARQPDGTLPQGGPWGLTMPLVTTRSGQKFGKTEAGAVWLDAALTSPYQFYQFWMQVEDDDVERYLKYFTFLDAAEIDAITAAHRAAPHLRQGQRRLAQAVTQLVHPADLAAVEAATAVLFGGNPLEADAATLEVLRGEVPGAQVEGVGEVTLGQLLVGDGRLFASNGEARRAIQQGAVTVSGLKWTGELSAPLPAERWLHGRYALLRKGKKDWHLAVRG
jgi:tyrosyl-tRNA synthetase